MSKNEKEELKKQEAPAEQMKLDDARRVKVLSPGMLVFKRFIRNKLAVAGIIILAVMFTFSFIGPLFSPYERAQIFTKEVDEPGKYATGKFNKDSRFVGDASNAIQSAVLKALGSQKSGSKYNLTEGQEIPFTANKQHYTLRVLNPSETAPSTAIYGTKLVATVTKGKLSYQDPSLSEEAVAAILADAEAGAKGDTLEVGQQVFTIEASKVERKYFTPAEVPQALSTFNIYTSLRGKVAELQSDTEFLHAVNLALLAGESSVDYGGKTYTLEGSLDEGIVLKGDNSELFNITRDYRFGKVNVEKEDADGNPFTEEVDFFSLLEDQEGFKAALNEAVAAGESSFSFAEEDYTLETRDVEIYVTNANGELAVTLANSFDPVETKYDNLNGDLAFTYALETAIAEGASSFDFDGETFGLVNNGADFTVTTPAGDEMLLVSDIAYGPDYKGIELTVDFVKKLQEAMRSKSSSFSFVDQYGEVTEATINIVNENYYVSTLQVNSLIDGRSAPSSTHPLGTDINGMDVFTRLMYGGRVSLIVGFVVIFFELVIGVLIGGVSGYFGGVVDTLLMRFVELFNAIPFYPMLIILGSVMDNLHVGATQRLMLTMVILGVLGWTGIARIVRGQILSLREQDFMIAAEATGIRTSRKIFRHLIPNVMPLLIVNATAGLGGIILTEATLGFLGLGVKYPMASWGSIINQVNDMQVMKTAWWIWIPAGLFILTTVLGFNFVGDGLRDAFDPKMKR